MPFGISPHVAIAMVAFVAVSTVIGAATAGAGGWRSLVERYPASSLSENQEEWYRFASLRTSGGLVGTASYGNCVIIGIGDRGLSVRLWGPFSLFHPPFFLPWRAVEWWRTVEYPGGRRVVQLTVRDGGSLTFFGRAGAAIAARARHEGLTEGKPG